MTSHGVTPITKKNSRYLVDWRCSGGTHLGWNHKKKEKNGNLGHGSHIPLTDSPGVSDKVHLHRQVICDKIL